MTSRAQRLLLIGSSLDTVSHWRTVLSANGWNIEIRPYQHQLPIEECRNYNVVIVEPGPDAEDEICDLLAQCGDEESAAILPVLSDPSPGLVVNLIRMGISDVLLAPFDDDELLETVQRVAAYKSLTQENRENSRELERTNKELRESLDILKMDQMAGRQVQKNLLPQTPLIHEDYVVSHKIVPSLYLSGDFVAYNLVFDRYILFYIADVSGHGASSAFVTILLRFILRRIIRKHVRDNDASALSRAPEGFMEHVNRQLMATGLEKHITMFAASIDTKTNVMRYSVAAQVPMPILITEEDARFLTGEGKVIGLFEEATWKIYEMAVPGWFRLAMISDGLLETLPGETMDKQEDYALRTLQSHSGNHAEMCAALGLDTITEAADDVSILTVCRGVQRERG